MEMKKEDEGMAHINGMTRIYRAGKQRRALRAVGVVEEQPQAKHRNINNISASGISRHSETAARGISGISRSNIAAANQMAKEDIV